MLAIITDVLCYWERRVPKNQKHFFFSTIENTFFFSRDTAGALEIITLVCNSFLLSQKTLVIRELPVFTN